MLSLFLGYELIELTVLFSALEYEQLTLLQIFVLVLFSLAVDAIPALAYLIGKKLVGQTDEQNGTLPWGVLLALGAIIALFQSALFEFSILTPALNYLDVVISSALFFIVALIPAQNK